jgi:hypothetical protein
MSPASLKVIPAKLAILIPNNPEVFEVWTFLLLFSDALFPIIMSGLSIH